MILRRFSERARRERALARAPSGPLLDYLTGRFQEPETPVGDLQLLAVDFETTGLDPNNNALLSMGFVPVNGQEIDLSGARHLVVRSDADVSQSAVLHGVTDDALAQGVELDEAVSALLHAMTGRILLAHHAPIETGFTSRACRQLFHRPFAAQVVDTMRLQEWIVSWGFRDPPPGSLRLAGAREHFGLPRYRAHEALTDALACAELYLAQVALMNRDGPLTLKQLQR